MLKCGEGDVNLFIILGVTVLDLEVARRKLVKCFGRSGQAFDREIPIK
jgi:hypothetical protein